MEHQTKRLVALGAILAPTLHSLTDVMEWAQGGFSPVQLWLNYLAFLGIPAVMLGLYAAQRPGISRMGLAGAVLYGCSFIYFAHTTLLALEMHTPTYAELWTRLGTIYTVHGIGMIIGGAGFGWATSRAMILPRWTASLFLGGIALNLLVELLPVPEIWQTAGTLLRNAALVAMGWSLLVSGPMTPAGT